MGSRDAPIATQVNYDTSLPIVSSLTSPSSPAGTDFLFQNASSAPTLFVSVGKANSPGPAETAALLDGLRSVDALLLTSFFM